MEHGGINRNIVECKEPPIGVLEGRKRVLIETLWNVKYNSIRNTKILQTVLIETLWNVKAFYHKELQHSTGY